jgi:hypothetical protein
MTECIALEELGTPELKTLEEMRESYRILYLEFQCFDRVRWL